MSLISILIPTRNAERYIGATLESIVSQDHSDLEVIVIDDGSTDRSAEIARGMNDPRIRIIPGPQRGISAAFNAGLAEARGAYLARCDADDLYPPGRLAQQARFLDEHPEFGAVCGDFSTITASGKRVADSNLGAPAQEITAELQSGKGRSHMCAYLFRTQILRDIGGCREWFATSEDRDLQFRLAEATRIWYEPRPCYLYRLHDQSVTHTQKLAERAFFEQAARRFQQQRHAEGMDDLQKGTPPPIQTDGPHRPPQSAREQVQNILLSHAWRQHAAGMKRQAIVTGWRACITRPSTIGAWKSLAALMLK